MAGVAGVAGVVARAAVAGMAARAAVAGLLALSAWGATGALSAARAETVLVIEDFAPMKMVPSASAPRKTYAPLGLLLKTRRVNGRGDFVEATNGEEHGAFEEPGWLHRWVRPSSYLVEPGATKISLDLVVHQRSGPPERSARMDFPGRRYSVAQFLADSTALPDSYYVTASDPEDRSPWGGNARIVTPASASFEPPGRPERITALRSEAQYHLYVSLAGPKPIRSVRERVAIARVLVEAPGCQELQYVETEVATLESRTRKIEGPGNTAIVAIPASDLVTTSSAAGVQSSRIVYVADVTFMDGTTEMIARRLVVSWPLCL